MPKQEMLALASVAIDKAKQAGATEASVKLSRSRSVKLEYRERKVEKLQESGSVSLSLSVYVDGRYSSHSTNDLRDTAIESFVKNAVEMTRFLTVDPYRKLPDPKWYEARQDRDLKLFDNSFDSISPDSRHKLAQTLEDAALSQSDTIISATAICNDYISESVQVNSNGFEGYRQSTDFWMGSDVTVRGEGDRRPEGWDWRGNRLRSQLPDPREVGEEACKRALEQIGSKRIETQSLPMIVENRSASSLLRWIIPPIKGSNLQQKQSFYDGKLNTQVGSPLLTVTNDPFVEGGWSSRLFDSEGISARKFPLIEAGILKNYLLDSYYARKLDMDPTTGSTANLVFPEGTRDIKAIIGDLGEGILVNRFLGGNSNNTTGDFSLGISGHYFKDGVIAYPVSEMNISGNHLTFWNNLKEFGNDPYHYSSYRTPSMVFDGVLFTGA